jgi:hypothetical protein
VSICTYGEMRRTGTKLGKCDVKHHTRTSEILPKIMEETHKMLSRYCQCRTEIESGGFHKIEQFYTCTVDKHPNQGVEGKAPRIVSKHQK